MELLKQHIIFILTFIPIWLNAQIAEDSIITSSIGEVIIAATRTEKKAEDVAVPTVIVYGKEIQLSGYTQLNEILAEQTGMVITEDHGSGIQIQGFDPEYTMLLIDGDPMLGKNAGVIDLKRINLRNVARIEVVKGGASCLFGSDAMAGVINIITKAPKEEFTASVFSSVGNPTSQEIGANLSGKNNGVGWTLFTSYQNAHGFDLDKENAGVSVGKSNQLNLQAKSYFFLGEYEITPSLRFFKNKLPGDDYQAIAGPNYFSNAITEDIAGTLAIERKWNKGIKTKFKLYTSNYKTTGAAAATQIDAISEASSFQQNLINPEFQIEYPKSAKTHLLAGMGARIENLKAERYSQVPEMFTQYIFLQWQYRPWENMELISGMRADNGNWYGNKISPKFSAIYKLKKLNLKASYGYGFKTPDFRQLYLDFTNQAVGYSVLGTKIATQRITELENNGIITNKLPQLNAVDNLLPETSKSVNIGAVFFPSKSQKIEINFFQNWIQNLINAVPVASKANGQYIYSYINQESVITRGVALNYNLRFNTTWNITLGGQYLEAYDKATQQSVEDGNYFVRDENLKTQRLKSEDYLGLFGRSKYALNAKVAKTFSKINTDFFIRWTWRNPYPFADLNGNLIADAFDDIFPSYHMINATARWSNPRWSILFSARNLLNNTSLKYLPTNPGTNFLITINYNITQHEK